MAYFSRFALDNDILLRDGFDFVVDLLLGHCFAGDVFECGCAGQCLSVGVHLGGVLFFYEVSFVAYGDERISGFGFEVWKFYKKHSI